MSCFFSSCSPLIHSVFGDHQGDEGDNAFHIAAYTAKMIRENLEWLIVMLRNPNAAVEVRNHRSVPVNCRQFFLFISIFMSFSLVSFGFWQHIL